MENSKNYARNTIFHVVTQNPSVRGKIELKEPFENLSAISEEKWHRVKYPKDCGNFVPSGQAMCKIRHLVIDMP